MIKVYMNVHYREKRHARIQRLKTIIQRLENSGIKYTHETTRFSQDFYIDSVDVPKCISRLVTKLDCYSEV